jgi:type II secretory pathway predicted ATPase ExeA
MVEHLDMTTLSPPPASRQATVHAALGLRGEPFPIDPLAGAWVPLPVHEAILADVFSWLGSDEAGTGGEPGIGVIAGAAGLGKTRLLEQLVARLAAQEDRLIGVIPDTGPRRSDAQLLRAALQAFGGTPVGRTGLELTTELRTLLAAHASDVREPVLLIDHAALTGSQLEILRNIFAAGPDGETPRLKVVLLGPPELADRIARRRALAGLVHVSATITALDQEGTARLLSGRVAAMRLPEAGSAEVFSPAAMTAIWQESGGVPARIMALARIAVLDTIALQASRVEETVVRGLASQMGDDLAEGSWQETATDDTVLQTRLSLPGFEDAGIGLARRRGRQQ